DKSRPLPADLGDLEFIKYSSDEIRIVGNKEQLRKKIREVLDYLKQTTLSSGACLLRQNYKHLLKLTQRFLNEYHEDHPILRHIGGWYGQLSEEFEQEGASAFEFDARYYGAC